ncbi:MAG: D-cysteine desulfhydrase family protein [Caulobacteraceae bacterium]|nr:D-cysteine desulfhydrase family protein [Caulobacteraceae bacterium]
MLDQLDRRPRFALAHRPTPLAPMARLRSLLLSEGCACPPLLIKRDDCTGLAGGGNKARKLEFLVGEALAQDCDVLVTTGALQSNHARQTAAAAAAAGLGACLVLRDAVDYPGAAYRTSGNLLLDDILGAEVELAPRSADMTAHIDRTMERLTAAGRRPYFAPAGGSSACGALGYVAGYLELAGQLDERGGAEETLIIHASSSGGTQAGLLVAHAGLGGGPKVLGVNVYRKDAEAMTAEILALAARTAGLLASPAPEPAEVRLVNDWLGDGYGAPTAEMREAVALVARTEGILLDPVYAGKAMAGLLGLVRRGALADVGQVVFLHTGGMPALFAYAEEFAASDGAGRG